MKAELSITELEDVQHRSRHGLGQKGKDLFSFAIARDPILRFISAYKSKIACDTLHYSTDAARPDMVKALLNLQRIYSKLVQIDNTRSFPFTIPKPLSMERCSLGKEKCCLRFDEFVDTVVIRKLLNDAVEAHNRGESDARKHIKLVMINSHYRPQSDLCRYDVLHYDEVHRMEDMNNKTFRTLNDKLGNAITDGGAGGSGHDGVRSVMVPRMEHISSNRNDTVVVPTEEERRHAETLLQKLRVYLERDYTNEVLPKLYDYDTNKEMYILAIHEILVADRSVGSL